MGRQILTFVLVFVGIMLLMRTCTGEKAPEGGLAIERPDAPAAEAAVLRDEGGAEARLGPDGAVASLTDGGAAVIRPVPMGRRPFHVFLGQTDRAARIPENEWTIEEVPGGGWKYVFAREKLRIEKTVRFAAEGKALVLDLKAQGIPLDAVGLVLTCASGVELGGEGSGAPFAFSELASGRPRIQTLASLKQAREEAERGRLYTAREELTAAERVKRFGVFGSAFSVALEDPPQVSRLFVDVYRADREGGETEEAETWVELVADDGTIEGSFTLRWTPAAEAATTFPSVTTRPGTTHVLEDETFKVVFTDRGAAILEMLLKAYSTEAGKPPSPETWIPILNAGVAAGEHALTLSMDGRGVDLAHEIWEATPAADGRSILFSLSTPDGWTFRKRVALPPEGRFDLEVEIEIEAPAGATGPVFAGLVGPSGSYIGDSYRGIIGAEPPASFVLDRTGDDDTSAIDTLKKEPLEQRYQEERRGTYRAIGTRGTYFVCALVSEDPRNAVASALAKRIRLDKPQEREDGEPPTHDAMLGRVLLSVPLEEGRAIQRFRLYAGPNETEALRELEIEGCVNFGFFGSIGRALMWLLKALQGIVGSHGIAIMLLTVIVRGVLLPVSFRTQLSMQRYSKRIQKIKPLLDEIQKKYPKDSQRMNQERMKVMREHGVGLPLGCLMIFFQIPIWFALFQALRVEFAIRHQSFLWVADLSMPDRLLGLPFWPHWFNFLPILMLVLWVLQQKLAPTPGSDDPQVKMQMKMMKFMPFVFFFMLYNYAAALALYMCVSSVWTIAESKLVRRAIAKLG